MVLNGQIEISPLGYMRGRTFKNAFVIADEMQNSSPNQMYMLLTRIGENSRMVITGDLEQSDRFENNGLRDLIQKLKSVENTKNIMLVELNNTDIQRSELVSQVVALYNKPITSNQITSKQITNKIEYQNEIKRINEIKHINETKYEINREKRVSGNNDAAMIPLKDMNRLVDLSTRIV
jgi:hypothetical protein